MVAEKGSKFKSEIGDQKWSTKISAACRSLDSVTGKAALVTPAPL